MKGLIGRSIRLFSLLCLCVSTTYAAPASTTLSYTTTINDLLRQDGFTLQGMGAGRELYLPIMPNWNVSKIHLHLIVTRDQTPNANSNVTALVRDFPFSSINLSTATKGAVAWDMDIPTKALDGKLVTLALRRNWNEQGTTCNNFMDPGSWIAFSGDSTIKYDYTTKTYVPDLSKFPSPFVIDPSVKKDSALIIMPDDFKTEELESVYYVASSLIQRQTWRGLAISGDTISHVTDEAKSTNNVIVTGTASRISKIIGNVDLPLKRNSEGKWTDQDGVLIPDNTGIIFLATSPWNQEHALLIVTGNGPEGVIKAGRALREKDFNKTVLFSKYVLVTNAVRTTIKRIDWKDTTLEELGYKDSVIYGGGQNTIKYDIDLPVNQTPLGMDIELDYSASPLLSARNSSFISLKMNGFPVTGVRISAGENQRESWKFHIDQANLLPGKNHMDFVFNLKFYNTDCSPDDLSLAWGVIYDTSKISVDLSERVNNMTFSDFSAMKQNISVFLPQNNNTFSQQELLALTINMARNIFNINEFNVYYDDANIADVSKDSNIIYIGSVTDNAKLNSYRNQLPFCYLNNRLVVKQSIMPFLHVSHEIPAALIELFDSPFNKDQQFLLITGNSADSYNIAVDTFFNPQKNQYLRGNAALAYSDGTFTSIDTNRLEQKAENTKLIKITRRAVMIGFISFVSVFFGGILLLIMYRRAKRYFSKSPN